MGSAEVSPITDYVSKVYNEATEERSYFPIQYLQTDSIAWVQEHE